MNLDELYVEIFKLADAVAVTPYLAKQVDLQVDPPGVHFQIGLAYVDVAQDSNSKYMFQAELSRTHGQGSTVCSTVGSSPVEALELLRDGLKKFLRARLDRTATILG